MEQIRIAREEGKTNVVLTTAELEALERRKQRQQSEVLVPIASIVDERLTAQRAPSLDKIRSKRKMSINSIFGSPSPRSRNSKSASRKSSPRRTTDPVAAPVQTHGETGPAASNFVTESPESVVASSQGPYVSPQQQTSTRPRSSRPGSRSSSTNNSRRYSNPPPTQFDLTQIGGGYTTYPRPSFDSFRPPSSGSRHSSIHESDFEGRRGRSDSVAQQPGAWPPSPIGSTFALSTNVAFTPPSMRRVGSGPPEVAYSKLLRRVSTGTGSSIASVNSASVPLPERAPVTVPAGLSDRYSNPTMTHALSTAASGSGPNSNTGNDARISRPNVIAEPVDQVRERDLVNERERDQSGSNDTREVASSADIPRKSVASSSGNPLGAGKGRRRKR
ncbi:hypothetical protein M501DRAFT_1012040 [Patellaria atrata CBS 101060]|uniref:Uncharacterized protein n=1 Tax=Patellaria atrata CBS 101060 TaxID=1346257 RepID=A0A9P4VV46_9PEZI|nr:hypothetical protein M501DRAFT_1012040 [Patellaria atrata CBS 101060]